MHPAHVGVVPCLPVPRPVVPELSAPTAGIERATDLRPQPGVVVPVLVDVVAEAKHEIDVVALGDRAEGVAVAGRVLRAREDREADLVDGPGRERAGSARRRDLSATRKRKW